MSAPATRLDIGQLLDADLPPLPWRVDRFACDGFVTVFAGHGGEGKSWIALALAVGVVCGTTIAGMRCTRGTALMLDGENGERLIARRYRAVDGPREGVAIYEAGSLDLAKTDDAKWIADTIRAERASFVVLDSLRSLAPRLEESNGDTVAPVMRNLRLIARATEAAIVVIHHRPKNSGAAYRGSSVLRDQADLLGVLEREPKDPEHRTRRCLHFDGARGGKVRIDAEPDDRWLHLHSTGGYITVDEADPFARRDGGGSDLPTTVDLLTEAAEAVLIEHPEGITQADLARALNREPRDQSVRRALARLADEGRARRESQNGPWHPTETPGVNGVTPLADTLPGVGVSQLPKGGLTPDTPTDPGNGNGVTPPEAAVVGDTPCETGRAS